MRRRPASRVLRIALALLLGTSFARTASADEFAIPQKLLDHEARVRAAFTPAQRSRQAALEARVSSKMSVHDVVGLMGGSSPDELIACLMKYMKDCVTEARENRKLKASFARQSLAAQASKLDQENARIEASMREAKEKAQNAMNQATAGLAMGIAAGSVQIGAGAASFAGGTAAAPTKTPTALPVPTVNLGAVRK